ncbi:hypothetical protein M3O57_01760 [Xanthomonas nasturtii]|uniref:oxidoreductase n=1 Tax=Xanthomonas nasturtii TaxID=1843581 RepID=UPI00201360E4|nr:hypothetical protein [Xanthomonas nasturtii]MCL1563943.1 hypothetical protein [Xanthomonas nasturtii]MCL1567808.1 hypothetical protein [Xanthomonas nasturtii]MCL1571642.1 hypothetical protein [Xanthomonas nasturtii]MCL1579622.1 hypothetical protein [Xanthomonas nasturtii]
MQRARDAGFRWLELPCAHGSLAQSVFSVHVNQRQDQYGGDAKGRARFLLETLHGLAGASAAHRTFWRHRVRWSR